MKAFRSNCYPERLRLSPFGPEVWTKKPCKYPQYIIPRLSYLPVGRRSSPRGSGHMTSLFPQDTRCRVEARLQKRTLDESAAMTWFGHGPGGTDHHKVPQPLSICYVIQFIISIRAETREGDQRGRLGPLHYDQGVFQRSGGSGWRGGGSPTDPLYL